MTSRNALVVVCMLLVSGAASLAGDAGSSLGRFEALVAKWVDLRARIASEKRAWIETDSQWREEIKLLESEKGVLEKEIAETGPLKLSVQKTQEDLLKKKETLTAAIEALKPALDKAEVRIRQWEARVPSSLAGPIRKAFLRLPRNRKEAESLPVVQRLQLVIALYTQIETLQHTIHVTQEVLPVESGNREMTVMYLGLAQAFAVSADDQWAAVGTPGPEGWTWAPRRECAPAVREAIEIFERRKMAALVVLPLRANDGKAAPE